ncbi:DUF917 family protein [Virgibacillus halotolerans]|uniref:DUF917 domain-containing protein n=1 Tax=Virgibacillus halotolerans TaxID=1071053 RepID=UPI00195F391D|nr:DUF917 family protein [Virgibacillus halotolerans]MBM7599119.1 DUF917 family protein [Virgibacillus halotolerans]
MTKNLSIEDGKHAVYGGCILGGGGGGMISEGLEKVEQAFQYGAPQLITAEELEENDSVVCVSLVGAPSAKEMYLSENQLIDTVQRMQGEYKQPIKALMTNENGAATTTNGWLQAAALNLPFLDAPCNGRAHPTGSMGALNLSEVEDYHSIQAFAGGKDEKAVSGIVTGSLRNVSDTMRELSVKAGGMIGVCRNPINVKYVKKHAAIGGITQAIELGEILLSSLEGSERIKAVVKYLNGEIVHTGEVTEFSLEETGGFDVGEVIIDDLELTFWNEYMTAEMNEQRLGTFPDLIMTFDARTGMPIVSAEIEKGQKIAVISVPKSELTLSSTMSNKKLLQVIEPIINKKIIRKDVKR